MSFNSSCFLTFQKVAEAIPHAIGQFCSSKETILVLIGPFNSAFFDALASWGSADPGTPPRVVNS